MYIVHWCDRDGVKAHDRCAASRGTASQTRRFRDLDLTYANLEMALSFDIWVEIEVH